MKGLGCQVRLTAIESEGFATPPVYPLHTLSYRSSLLSLNLFSLLFLALFETLTLPYLSLLCVTSIQSLF